MVSVLAGCATKCRAAPHFLSPAFVTAAHQLLLLDAVRQELRPTQREADLGEQLRQQNLPLLGVVTDPRQHRL